MPAGRDESNAVIKNYTAGSIVPPYRFVKPGGTAGTAVVATAETDAIIGISHLPLGQYDVIRYGQAAPAIQANINDSFDVVMLGSGLWIIELGAALAEGSLVKCDNTSRAVAAGTVAAGATVFRLLSGGAAGSFQTICMAASFKV